MRVSPVGFAYDTKAAVLREAQHSAEVTHSHPEGIKGAQATALAIFLARTGASKEEIHAEIQTQFGYDLDQTLDQIRPDYTFDVSCQGSVPPSIRAFLESTDFEDALRNTISLGGDADTMGSITGGIAQGYYRQISQRIRNKLYLLLPEEFLQIIDEFNERYGLE
jgi:ADP-ribosylglycohydrolase